MESTQTRTTSVRGTIREGLWEMQGIGTMMWSPLSLEKRDLHIDMMPTLSSLVASEVVIMMKCHHDESPFSVECSWNGKLRELSCMILYKSSTSLWLVLFYHSYQSKTWCKIVIIPLLTHWSYCSLAQSHWSTTEMLDEVCASWEFENKAAHINSLKQRQMATVFQTTFSNSFSWNKLVFWLNLDWS